MKTQIKFSLLFLFLGLIVSCTDDSDYEPYDAVGQYQADSVLIDNYIKVSDLDFEPVEYDGEETGIYISYLEEGTEDTDVFPTVNSEVECYYVGKLLDGTTFDSYTSSKYENPVSFGLYQVISGWKFSLMTMTKGDNARVILPSFYGYRDTAVGSIPANSVLIFDIELVDFDNDEE